jgi:hypothetical protein
LKKESVREPGRFLRKTPDWTAGPASSELSAMVGAVMAKPNNFYGFYLKIE